MQEIFKSIDFNVFGKGFINDIYDIQISNLGRVKKNDKFIHITNRNDKRLIFRLNVNNKRYEFGVASCLVSVFLDRNFSEYDISFNDNNPLNVKLANITLVYRHRYRQKDDALINVFNTLDYSKMKKIFCKMLFQKNIRWKSYCDYEDFYQEYLLFCYERLNLLDKRKHRDIYQFCCSLFKTWFSKRIRSKISSEKFDYISLDRYLSLDDSYNYIKQLY